MHRVKNQHYYPQSSLRRFADKDERVYCFDKPTGKVFRSSVSNVASEQGFYDLPPQFAADPQVVEKTFSEIEGGARPLFDQLLADVEATGRFNPADPDWRARVSAFVAIQDCRTRSFRQTFSQLAATVTAAIAERHAEAYRAEGVEAPEPTFDFRIDADALSGEHAGFMFTTDYLAEAASALARHIWLVAQNDTDQPFYTSDAPVVRHANDLSWSGGMGLASRGIEVIFPLSPRHALALLERTHFSKMERLEGGVLLLKPDGVAFYNGLQIHQCRRQVYCSENKFDQVLDFRVKYPHVFDPDRTHVEIKTGLPSTE